MHSDYHNCSYDILFGVIESRKIPTKTILGIPIVDLNLKEISSVIFRLIEGTGKKTFFYVDANHFNIAEKDPIYKKILQGATFVHASGMGPIFASRMLGRSLPGRTPTPDFIYEFFAKAEDKNWSIYLLGGEEYITEKTTENLLKRFPKLIIAGYSHGFFAKNNEIVEKINKAKPDVILVGMGPPIQEKWIMDNIDKVNAKTFWAVGALFDILSGKRKRPPKWMQGIGLEWLYRLGQEPGRLWKRYIFGNIVFLITVFQEIKLFSRKTSR